MKLSITTNSSQETKEIAKSFAGLISKKKNRIIFLKGDLGSGKTTFVLGFLSYFGIKPSAASPTFVIMKSYRVGGNRVKGIEKIHHIDAYRLKSKKDLDLLGFEEIKNDNNAIVLIEWPERIKGLKLKDKTVINFSYGEKESERRVAFTGN